MSDHLKYFAEHLPATFVYAGINVENSGLFTGRRGRQISARSVLKTTGPFPYGDEFRPPIATLEEALRLHDHAPGTLTRERPVSAPAHRRRNQQLLAPHPSGRHQRHPAPDRTLRPSATGRNRRRPCRRKWLDPARQHGLRRERLRRRPAAPPPDTTPGDTTQT